jgi:hypothetical protein
MGSILCALKAAKLADSEALLGKLLHQFFLLIGLVTSRMTTDDDKLRFSERAFL